MSQFDFSQDFMSTLEQVDGLSVDEQKKLPKELVSLAMGLTKLSGRAAVDQAKGERALNLAELSNAQKLRMAELQTQRDTTKAQMTNEQRVRMAELQLERDRIREAERRATADVASKLAINRDSFREVEDRKSLEFKANLSLAAEQRANREAENRVLRLATEAERLINRGPANEQFRKLIEPLTADATLASVGGLEMAADLERRAIQNHYVATTKLASHYSGELAKEGITPPKEMEAEIGKAISENRSVRQYIDGVRETHAAEVKTKADESARMAQESAGVRRLVEEKGFSPKEAESVFKAGAAEANLPPGDVRRGMAEREALAAKNRGKLWKYGGAAAIGALIASKVFGKDQQGTQIPPELQMALAAKANAGGGDTGKDLVNVGRMLSIIKTLQGMNQMQTDPSQVRLGSIV